MKRYTILLSLLVVALTSTINAFAGTTPAVPSYAHKDKPSCTCSCNNRLIYTHAKITYKNLVKWSQEAAIASYSYGFGNYKTALKNASQYYTANGWDSFSEALTSSKNLNIITNKKLLVKAIPIGKPKVVLVSKNSHPKRWRVVMPVLVKYENSNNTVHDSLNITMDVVSTDPKRGVQGLGIDSFVAKRIA